MNDWWFPIGFILLLVSGFIAGDQAGRHRNKGLATSTFYVGGPGGGQQTGGQVTINVPPGAKTVTLTAGCPGWKDSEDGQGVYHILPWGSGGAFSDHVREDGGIMGGGGNEIPPLPDHPTPSEDK